MDISDYNEAIFTSWFKLRERIPSELIRENKFRSKKAVSDRSRRGDCKELQCTEFGMAYRVSLAAIPLSVEVDKRDHSTPVR